MTKVIEKRQIKSYSSDKIARLISSKNLGDFLLGLGLIDNMRLSTSDLSYIFEEIRDRMLPVLTNIEFILLSKSEVRMKFYTNISPYIGKYSEPDKTKRLIV